MLVQLTIGFFVAAIVFIAFMTFGLFSDYIRTMKSEGFTNHDGDATVIPGANDENSVMSPGFALSSTSEKLVESARLPAMSVEEAESNWGSLTSEKCYRTDIGESLKKTRNYLQRTNNYQREHPDSCSAPNHEFIGTFYTPKDGVGRYPEPGTKYPPSTQGCMNFPIGLSHLSD